MERALGLTSCRREVEEVSDEVLKLPSELTSIDSADKKLFVYCSCCSSEEPLPLLSNTAFAQRFFIADLSSAAGHPIEKGHTELKDSAKRSQSC